MAILGLGGLMGDAACAVLRNGELKAAIEENKLTRGWRSGGIPHASIAECLRIAGATRDQVECVAIARPFAQGPEAHFHIALRELFPKAEMVVLEHHQAHAASAFYASPFEESVVLTLDHSGDFRCGSRWYGKDTQKTKYRQLFTSKEGEGSEASSYDLIEFADAAIQNNALKLTQPVDVRFAPNHMLQWRC